ncbi:MAG: transcription elongation factor GreA [Pseudomonadales bacterium]|nr:transcription elongation factor GreA [Pseudomonadales bacterium]MBO6567069.1 transcription elongation factor GreA [Pseudomonadales bacterium]MBO6597453.1 transcription elongation factor GreA [Pseudomonadales bacterium]MBO6658691.1 transcription elongation factor GreA [Pseudomonadales bacterium]MBO6703052.1 transcription elongation factor GreA [Pseudomonadales bacterium]
MDKIPMTASGENMLREELDKLKGQERPRIVQAIAEARAQGDLRENAEYQYAKEEQGFIEGRIAEIEGKLSNAQVIDVTQIPESGKVIFGTTVELMNLETDEEITYQIVGDDESDIKLSKISVYSPIARALIGKEVDDVVVVKTPNGDVEYEICAVKHI